MEKFEFSVRIKINRLYIVTMRRLGQCRVQLKNVSSVIGRQSWQGEHHTRIDTRSISRCVKFRCVNIRSWLDFRGKPQLQSLIMLYLWRIYQNIRIRYNQRLNSNEPQSFYIFSFRQYLIKIYFQYNLIYILINN